MTITKRTLELWRANSLTKLQEIEGWDRSDLFSSEPAMERRKLHQCIIRLTAELLDQHLLRKVKKL